MVIAGAKDELIPIDELQDLAAMAPLGRLKVIPNAAHISNMENPELFNQFLFDFLESYDL